MPEVDPHESANEALENLLAEARRHEALLNQRLTTVLSDSDLLKLAQQAREIVDTIEIGADNSEIRAPFTDPESGPMTGLLPRKTVLILAETCHLVRELLARRFKESHADLNADLFHVAEVPGAREVQHIMPGEVTNESSQRVQAYVRVALDLDREGVLDDIANANAPNPELVQGALHIDTPALAAPEAIINGVNQRFARIFNTPPVHIVRSMKEWRNWTHLIKPATEADVPDIHALYRNVLMPRERLVRLDPRYATQSEFLSVADDVRNHGAMFKALRTNGDDEVLEGIRSGRIVIIRDDPQEDEPNTPGDLIGFYNVVGDPDAVRTHMKNDLLFSDAESYDSIVDLPHFSRVPTPNGEKRTIAYSDEENARRIFKAALEGKLGWSVDHAIAMNGSQKLQRYAQAGTALKLAEYEYMQHELGKQFVLMKVATVVGVDSSAAANELGMQPVAAAEWQQDGKCSWNVDQSGMVILPRAIVNVGSTMLNGRLGAMSAFTVTEEFTRDGVKVRIIWNYLYQPLPAFAP